MCSVERDTNTARRADIVEAMACTCPNIKVGSEITENRNLDPDSPLHGVGTGYWSSPALAAQVECSVEMQRRAARARRVDAVPGEASDSDRLRVIADRMDLDDDRAGRAGGETQVFLRRLADRLESDGAPGVNGPP